MDILYKNGRATATEVQTGLPKPPSYSAVRAMLRVLEEKGHIRHEEKDLRYVFLPTVPRDQARRSAASHLMHTFFENSVEQTVATLLDVSSRKLSLDDLDRIAALIAAARKEGK